MKELDRLQHKFEQTTDKKEKIRLLRKIAKVKQNNEVLK